VSNSVAKWIIDMDMDGWRIRCIRSQSCSAEAAGSLAKVFKCKTVWGHYTIGISIIVMLYKLLTKIRERDYTAHIQFSGPKE
jgi:hypothetical protein